MPNELQMILSTSTFTMWCCILLLLIPHLLKEKEKTKQNCIYHLIRAQVHKNISQSFLKYGPAKNTSIRKINIHVTKNKYTYSSLTNNTIQLLFQQLQLHFQYNSATSFVITVPEKETRW